ncbi:hypothetical protein IAR50_002651 [Cryptococcus sp. DSM 104548]
MLFINLFALLPLLVLTSARPYDDKLIRRRQYAVAAVVVSASTSVEQEKQKVTQVQGTIASSTYHQFGQEASINAFSSVAGKTATSTFPSAQASSTGSPSGLSTDAQTLVDLHNALRAQYSAGNETWNDDLASYAATAATTCDFEHTGGPYGENLAAGVGDDYDVTAGFQSWADEAYKSPPFPPSYNGTYSHFTQVVWKATTEIGCATSSCADGTIFTGYGADSLYLVCQYNPAGDVLGESDANVAASKF